MLSATFTVKPMLWLVSESCSSSWVRSVTKTTFHCESDGCRYISRTMNIMVSDLPEPCVCQMMPLRSRGRLAFQQTLHGQLDGAELLIAPDDLDRLAFVVGGEEREGADEVEQVVAVEHPGHEPLLVVGAAAPCSRSFDGAREMDRPSGRNTFRCAW